VSLRRAALGLGSALLLLLLLGRNDPVKLGRRAGLLLRSAPLDSNTRRLKGTATAFDRQFFVFLESVRRNLPPGTRGVAVLGVPRTDQVFYLATYHFAPIPVLVAPEQVPTGWLLAIYGPDRPPGWKVIAPVWKGALMTPAS
jgi:hypothetical protein